MLMMANGFWWNGFWPRGLKKENAKVDEAPSSELRKWYGHDPAKWLEFKTRYWSELKEKKDVVEKLRIQSTSHTVTFLFGASKNFLP